MAAQGRMGPVKGLVTREDAVVSKEVGRRDKLHLHPYQSGSWLQQRCTIASVAKPSVPWLFA